MTEQLAAPPRATRTRTIGALWRDAVARGRSFPAYLVEEEGGGWRDVSWTEAATRVDELANGLLALGVGKGDVFAIVARTTLEWSLFDFALASVGAIGAPVYPSLTAHDTQYVVRHSEAIGALVEDEEQRAKLDGLVLAHVLSYAELDELAARGRAYAASHPEALAEALAGVEEDDVFTYIYTSGTTGPPKGCVITHRNYWEMVAVIEGLGDLILEGETMLLYLPLAHNFGRLMHLGGPYVGYTIAFCPDPLRIGEVLPAVRPHVFPSVPRVYEKIHAAVVGQFDAATGIKRRIVDRSLAVGREASRLKQEGRPLPRGLALRHRLARRLVFERVHARMGGRVRICIAGGAPLAKEVAEFFHTLDLLILEGYGLTECTSAATVNRPDRFRFGTVGLALPGTELRLAEDGELLISSATVFAGYLKDPAATAEVLEEDGWLRSGDIAELDADGFVTITDRKKDILVTAGGKNVAPANIENLLKSSRHISQALVVGDRRPYAAALVTLDPDAHLDPASAEARALVQEAVDRANAHLSRFEQVKRFAILPRDFSAAEGEITPTLKVKRKVCQEHFAAEIAALYE